MTRYKNLFTEIENCKPKVILEIGTWNGVHAMQMINHAGKFQPKDDIVYYGVDLWEGLTPNLAEQEYCGKRKATKKEAEKAIYATGVEYHLLQGFSSSMVNIKTIPNPPDFVFIDGGHSIETIASDFENVSKIIHQNSVVLLDDYYIENNTIGCKQLVQKLLNSGKWFVTMLPHIDKDKNGLKIQMVRVTNSS